MPVQFQQFIFFQMNYQYIVQPIQYIVSWLLFTCQQYIEYAKQYIDNSPKKIKIAEIEQVYGLDDGDQNEGMNLYIHHRYQAKKPYYIII